jgi:hypothetical protein
MRKSKAFREWTALWRKAVRRDSNEEEVIRACKQQPPTACLRKLNPRYDLVTGFKRNRRREARGEQEIELALLGDKRTRDFREVVLQNHNQRFRVTAFYNHLPLTVYRPGQAYPDAVGMITLKNGEVHTLAIEVKVSDNDCWYATVENLKQIKLLRANLPYQKRLLQNVNVLPTATRIYGTWGLILAPESFYSGSEKRKRAFERTESLINTLTETTELRVILGVWDNKKQSITYKSGYWPS